MENINEIMKLLKCLDEKKARAREYSKSHYKNRFGHKGEELSDEQKANRMARSKANKERYRRLKEQKAQPADTLEHATQDNSQS